MDISAGAQRGPLIKGSAKCVDAQTEIRRRRFVSHELTLGCIVLHASDAYFENHFNIKVNMMKKLIIAILSGSLILAAAGAYAEDAMSKDGMQKNDAMGQMSPDSMKKDGMKKKKMHQGSMMKQDNMSKKNLSKDGAPNSGMTNNTMKKDTMGQ